MTESQLAQPHAGPSLRPVDAGRNTCKTEVEGIGEWLVEDLHDMVAQPLWYLAVELSSLHRDLSPDLVSLRERLEALEDAAQEAYERLRLALGWARNPERPSVAIADLVRQQVASFERQTGVEVKVTVQAGSLSLPPERAHHVGAVLQEALWNARRHGRAQEIEVAVAAGSDTALLTVTDAGGGFVELRPGEGHLGLDNMAKRAQALGAELRIASIPGQGTQVALVLPLQN